MNEIADGLVRDFGFLPNSFLLFIKSSSMKKKENKKSQSAFSLRLANILKDREISIRHAASLAGISSSSMNEWLSGSATTNYEAVSRLCKALNISFSYLLLGEGTEEVKEERKTEISDLYDELPTEFEGIFKISAKRLVRKK